jgi:hypothetical protein
MTYRDHGELAMNAKATITELSPHVYRLDDADIYEVPSRSQTDVARLVIYHALGWYCTCPAKVALCWHVEQVRKALEIQS